jgi:hypothetical protein
MTRLGANLADLLDRYICLEREIQTLVSPLVRGYCAACAGVCCKREICKESIESEFLSILVAKQGVRYDDRSGWLGPAGCRLEYGRPLVCYEFFCEDIQNSPPFQNSPIKTIVNDFAAIGNRVSGNTHLICLATLEVLTPKKIDRLCDNITALTNRIAEAAFRFDTS